MRESLKNLFSNRIILENGAQYYYTVRPFELTNVLGNVIAVLQQYTFTNADQNKEPAVYTLYKTKEGNWYDAELEGISTDKRILRMLKSAIDKKEDEKILE